MAQNPGAVPVTIEVTIDLNEALSAKYAQDPDGEYYESGPPNLQRAIFDAVVDKLADRTLAEAPKDYYPSLRDEARKVLNEKLNAQAADIVEDALAQVVASTDRFGQPKGEPRTFREYMAEQIMGWLTAPTRDSHSGRSRSNAQNIIEGALDRKFETELRKAVEAGKAQALALVRERAAAHMAAAIGDLAEKAGESRG
jgi:DNA-directed RNA polymerase specialized sigma24 family protein